MADSGEISLSFEETNALRIKLGLKPLNAEKSTKVIHVDPSKPTSEDTAAALADRLAESKAKREAARKDHKALSDTSGAAAGSAEDWVNAMRAKNPAVKAKDLERKKVAKKAAGSAAQATSAAAPTTSASSSDYDAAHLAGLNVKHSASAFEAGTDTILTLADTNILDMGENGAVAGLNEDEAIDLENANLADEERVKKAIQKKRQMQSLAQGYAAYDDDEFEELGGSGVPMNSNSSKPSLLAKYDQDEDASRGFTLGGGGQFAADPDSHLTDFEKQQQGKQMSLQAEYGMATDYMTIDEAEAAAPKKKKEFKKKDKKDKKESKKRKERETTTGDDEEDTQPAVIVKKKSSILAELKEDDEAGPSITIAKTAKRASAESTVASKAADAAKAKEDKVKRFHETMLKGNARQAAKGGLEIVQTNADGSGGAAPMVIDGTSQQAAEEVAEDPSMKAALAKAARLKKLKEMKEKKSGKVDVVSMVAATRATEDAEAKVEAAEGGGMTIAFDDTSEFARKLKTQQELTASAPPPPPPHISTSSNAEKTMSMEEMEDMAKNITSEEEMNAVIDAMEEDDAPAAAAAPAAAHFADTMADSQVASRGMSGVLAMLKATGDLTGKKGGKEELRGRANDEKNYADYEAANLDSVVRVDRNKATNKDLMYLKREVKLEYRDDHGRLLTRKEAFRNLCKDFHGFGSGKKKEEKKLKQIQFEAEARDKRVNESRGTMGALAKAQKTTGKAFLKLS
jgi:U4/U6.U5 tri-snRNP-associated protein 1